MFSHSEGHEERDSGSGSVDLGAELRRLIRELDAEDFPDDYAAETKSPIQEDEVQHESPVWSATMQSLKQDLEEANAETLLAVRLVQELMRVRLTELVNRLLRMEQSLQDEINLMEKRIRGDIIALRNEIEIGAASDVGEHSNDTSSG